MRNFGAVPPYQPGILGPPANGAARNGRSAAVPPPFGAEAEELDACDVELLAPPPAFEVAAALHPRAAAPPPPVRPAEAGGGLAAAIAEAVAAYLPAPPASAAPPLDVEAVRELAAAAAREAVASLVAETEAARPRLTVAVGAAPPVTLDGPIHEAVHELLAVIAQGAVNVMLVGPAGSGKTSAAAGAAAALGRPFGFLSLSGGTSESALYGRMLPTGEAGAWRREETSFIRAYRDGGVFLFDEVDAADPNVMVAVNAALANGHLAIPGGETIPRHADCIILAAANTFGTAAGGGRQYVGRNQLDAATLDRFAGAVIEVDYSPAIERAIATSYGDAGACALQWTWETRGKVQSAGLRRLVSTRALIACARATAAGGADGAAAFLRRFAAGWTAEERERAGLPVPAPIVDWARLARDLP